MYDHLLTCKKKVPLLVRFASKEKPPVEPLLTSNAVFNERLEHSGDKFPLAVAQRDTLGHYPTQQPGDILAVDDPPGTGKTTLVLSAIATEQARTALNKTEPPVVVVTLTSNQTVTNIIEAFGKDFSIGTGPIAKRWSPDVRSFGAYFLSLGRRAGTIKKHQTEAFFNGVESLEYVEGARCFFLEKARAAFPNEECHSTEQVVDLLHQCLVELSAEFEQIEPTWDDLNAVHQKWHVVSDDLEQYVQGKGALLPNSTSGVSLLTQGKKQWEQCRAGESIMFTLFSWLPAVRTERHYQMKLFLEATFGERMTTFQGSQPDGINAFIDGLVKQARKEQVGYQQQIGHAKDISQHESEAVIRWCEITHSLGCASETEPNLSEADELTDTQLRFPVFLLATHYWEGR